MIDTLRDTFDYRAFGLAIRSDWPMPELTAAYFTAPDLRIRRGGSSSTRNYGTEAGPFRFADQSASLHWPELGMFLLCDGDEIVVEPSPKAEPAELAFALLGPITALALHMRGRLVLHGSCVSFGGKGIAFLGDKGAGKSTTAAACIRAGHNLMTDDILALDLDTQDARVLPAFPQVKLSHEAAAAHAPATATRREPVGMVTDKDRFRLAGPFTHRPADLHTIFLLTRGDRPEIAPLAPALRFKALLRFSYINRFGPDAMTPAGTRRHFRQCATLAEHVPMAILTVPNTLGALPDAVAAVERHCR